METWVFGEIEAILVIKHSSLCDYAPQKDTLGNAWGALILQLFPWLKHADRTGKLLKVHILVGHATTVHGEELS